jgi:flagellar basal-body rod modification protein FlgD
MPTSAINGTSSSNAASTSVNRFADMSSEEFLKVLVTELQNQDPLNPSDSTKVLEQLSSIRNIESQTRLQSSFQDLVSQNSVSSASRLIGQYVVGKDENFNDVSGVAQSMRIENGKPILVVDDGSATGARVPIDNVSEVFDLGDYDSQVTQSLLTSMLVLNSNDLIGRGVEGTDADGVTRSGIVTGVSLQDNELMVELDTGFAIPATGLTRFTSTEQ